MPPRGARRGRAGARGRRRLAGALGYATEKHSGGPWAALRFAWDVPFSQAWYLRFEPEIVGHSGEGKSANSCDAIYPPSVCGTSDGRTYTEGKSSYTMSLVLVRAMLGLRLGDSFSARAGGYVGFGSGSVKRDSCGEGSAGGVAGGVTAAPALEISKKVELGLQLDFGITPSPRCQRNAVFSGGTQTFDPTPHYDTQGNAGWGATAFAVYFWR